MKTKYKNIQEDNLSQKKFISRVKRVVEDQGLKKRSEPNLQQSKEIKQIRNKLEFWLAISVQVRESNEITIVVGTR